MYIQFGKNNCKSATYSGIASAQGEAAVNTILIVDDEEIIRSLFRELSQKIGYNVLEVPDGETALNLCRSKKLDAILLDYVLPGINGIEVLQEIKKIIPEVPVIIMTGQRDIELAVQFMKLGAYDFISKPINYELMQEVIKRALNNCELQRKLKDMRISVEAEREINERLESLVKKRTAEAIHAAHLASIGELAAGVAHEINNPINGIINYAQVLVDKYPDQAGSEIPGKIIKEGHRIADIVKSLLSFARERKEEKTSVNIQETVSESLVLIGAQMQNDGIVLKKNIPPALPAINANPQHLQQVFLNVISNARYALNQKYPSAHEDKKLEIKCETVTLDGVPHVRTTFHDHGTGISPDLIGRVTDPFFSTKPAGLGTGLGLSISKDLVRTNRGKLAIESREGQFTRVIIDLPSFTA